jgi:glycosyltransferase involved in cell wall biosynthesis
MQGAENFAYRRADWVVSMLPNAESHMRRHGLSAGKFVYLPNGVHPSEWREGHDGVPALHYEAIRRMKAEGRFLVGYAGAHGVANALDCVVHAATLLRDTPVVVALFGNGAEKRRLMDLVSRLNLVNVKFFPPVPKSAVPDLFDCMDVLLITLQRNSIFRFGISPNKLLDYMMAAKPIIQAIDASNDMVRESGCGISVRPEDPNEIAAAALRMLELSALQRMEMGKRGRSYVTAHHDYRVLAAQFLAVLQAKPPTDVSTCETNYAQR